MRVQDGRSAFAQLTVRVRATHKFAAYDGRRRLVAGDPEREVPVQDVWVLERSFKEGPTSRWRVAGGRSLPACLPSLCSPGACPRAKPCHSAWKLAGAVSGGWSEHMALGACLREAICWLWHRSPESSAGAAAERKVVEPNGMGQAPETAATTANRRRCMNLIAKPHCRSLWVLPVAKTMLGMP